MDRAPNGGRIRGKFSRGFCLTTLAYPGEVEQAGVEANNRFKRGDRKKPRELEVSARH